jgi:hypothetical protein
LTAFLVNTVWKVSVPGDSSPRNNGINPNEEVICDLPAVGLQAGVVHQVSLAP